MNQRELCPAELPPREKNGTLSKDVPGIDKNRDPIHDQKKRLPKEPRSGRSIFVDSRSDELSIPQNGTPVLRVGHRSPCTSTFATQGNCTAQTDSPRGLRLGRDHSRFAAAELTTQPTSSESRVPQRPKSGQLQLHRSCGPARYGDRSSGATGLSGYPARKSGPYLSGSFSNHLQIPADGVEQNVTWSRSLTATQGAFKQAFTGIAHVE